MGTFSEFDILFATHPFDGKMQVIGMRNRRLMLFITTWMLPVHHRCSGLHRRGDIFIGRWHRWTIISSTKTHFTSTVRCWLRMRVGCHWTEMQVIFAICSCYFLHRITMNIARHSAMNWLRIRRRIALPTFRRIINNAKEMNAVNVNKHLLWMDGGMSGTPIPSTSIGKEFFPDSSLNLWHTNSFRWMFSRKLFHSEIIRSSKDVATRRARSELCFYTLFRREKPKRKEGV